MTFYNNIQSCVINNGITTDYFTLERGVRQGDPLSPYLFVVAVETLAIAVRQNKAITGITIGKDETKLLQYADDTTAVLADVNSARILFKLLDDFKKLSGLAINPSKTEGLWIGSSRGNKTKPFGIKWPNEPIKALGVYYSYDPKLLLEKNFIEKLDTIKKLINIWSSRGLSLYGKVTIIKLLIIPKFVYVASLLPTPKEVIKQLNQLLFKFLWKGVDKVTRLSAINEYENGGLKMIDFETMVKSLRLAWLKRIFRENDGAWKSYIRQILKQSGGFFLFRCNYDVKDIPIRSQFYTELLQWWSEFRIEFDAEKEWQNIIWNNKDIRINNKSVFYKNFFESGIIYVKDLLFGLNNIDSYNVILNIINKTNFLVWAGLRHAIPSHLKTNSNPVLETSHSLKINNEVFDVLEKISKHYYTLLISTKAKFPNNAQVLKRDFNLNEEQLKKVFILPHTVSSEPYVRAFQYKVLNSILFTNTKLFKIGFITEDKCSFCKSESETLSHLLFDCIKTKSFWRDFESNYYSLSKEFVHLTLKDVIVGIIITKCPLLNYLLLIAKIYLWDCRRTQILPNITGFKLKVKNKFETEKYVCMKNNTLDKFNKKWLINK